MKIAVTNHFETASPEQLGLQWLVRTRWLTAVLQVAVFFLSRDWLELDVQTLPALTVVAFTLLTNAVLRERFITPVLSLDIVLLTALLFVTGKEASPFSALYIVNVAVAARVASARVTAWIWMLSVVAFGSLFVGAGHHGEHATHYRGMWLAYALASALTGYFVARVTQALQRIARTSQAAQRLAATSTLAASAAHELGTPQNTIAVLAESISGSPDVPERYRADGRTILTQIARCRDILNDLGGRTAANMADQMAKVNVQDIVASTAQALGANVTIAADVNVTLPRRAFARVVSSLLKNALDAGATQINIEASAANGLTLTVRDNGSGISQRVMDRLGEPYFTTKPVGAGSGLGLYLSAVFAESMGGGLSVESEEGKGTTVELRMPASV